MPNWTKSVTSSQRIDVVLFQRFSNHCLANAIEPLRAANELARRQLYSWRYLTTDGRSVMSSSGLAVEPQASLREGGGADFLFVLPSYGFKRLSTPELSSALQSAATRYGVLVGLDTGSWLMAAAGLLSGRKATIHWDVMDDFSERFPDVNAVQQRFVVDGACVTCGGAMAAFDLVTWLIAVHHGEALRLEVEHLFMHGSPATHAIDVVARGKSSGAQRAVALMRDNLEEPLVIGELARRAGRTQRDLERLFQREFGTTPRVVYRRLRLLTVRRLLEESTLPISEIAIRCGYSNSSAMTRAFKAEFNTTPRAIRGVVFSEGMR